MPDYKFVVSTETLAEFFKALSRSKFDKYASLASRLQFLNAYRSRSIFVEVTHSVKDCRDPKDDKFLNLRLFPQLNTLLVAIQTYWSFTPIMEPEFYLRLTSYRDNRERFLSP